MSGIPGYWRAHAYDGDIPDFVSDQGWLQCHTPNPVSLFLHFIISKMCLMAICFRQITFEGMLRQECGWFDEEEHSVGILSSYLSGDAANIQAAIGFPLCVIIQSISTVVLGTVIALSISIKLAAVCLASLFFMIPIVLLEARYQYENLFCLFAFK